MASTGVRRVVPMILGFEHLALRVSMPLAEQSRLDTKLREPVPGLLLEVDGGWFLVDSGFNTPLVRDPWLHRRFFSNPSYQPELVGPENGDPLEAAFALAGVDPRDVVGVIISHLHVDHAGGIRHFTGQAPIYLQRAELAAAEADPRRSELSGAMFRIDWDDPAVDWRLLDGDAELAPGITAILTAGHTPGHMSVVVEVDPSCREHHAVPGYVFACDAADLQENLDHEQPVSAPAGQSPEITLEAIRKMKSIAFDKGYRVMPGHDPVVWPAFAAEMGVEVFV
jgi:glyoxylase-like metal-dependent hydrolase (beta-lactamase superfamily II)